MTEFSPLLARRRVLPGERVRTAERAPERSGVGGPYPRARCAYAHPLQALQAFRGPLRCHMLRFTVRLGSTRYYPPCIPTLYPPWSHTRPVHPSRTHHDEHVTVSRYTRFGHLVGEPRGMRTHPVFWVLTVFSTDPEYCVLQEIMTETVFWGPLWDEACGRSILRSILRHI